MSLRDVAALDGMAIIDGESIVVDLTAPAALGGHVYSLSGMVSRVGVSIDPNGMPVSQDTTTVTLSLVKLAGLGLTDPDSIKKGAWTVATTDVNGATVSGTVSLPLLDRTLGRLTFQIKRNA